jgi:hypothetical protein
MFQRSWTRSTGVLFYLVQVLRAVMAEKLTVDQIDLADVWLAPCEEIEINQYRHIRLCFMIDDRVLCRIPYTVLVHAEASSVSRAN